MSSDRSVHTLRTSRTIMTRATRRKAKRLRRIVVVGRNNITASGETAKTE